MPWTRLSHRLSTSCLCAIAALTPHVTSATLTADQIAIIVNDNDPTSVEVGEYYAAQRRIPAANVVHVNLPHKAPSINSDTFKRVFDQVQKQTPPHVQAYGLTWALPYRVDCMSITSAFALGYATRYCAKGCRATAPNPYFNSASLQPYTDYRIRPTMAIAAKTLEDAKILINRGVESDFTYPQGKAYLVVTKDKARSSRAPLFALAKRRFSSQIPVSIVHSEGIRDKFDIMFYFTGSKKVPFLKSIGFLPGAMADHLTSTGGQLTKNKQMSALRWLDAGATGSYGTVVEPCNFPQKFPNPAAAMNNYLAGDTLVEAYWKSVIWPGQGIFIGEPLAKPYAVRNANDEKQ